MATESGERGTSFKYPDIRRLFHECLSKLHITLQNIRQNPVMTAAIALSHRVPQLPAETWRAIFGNSGVINEDLIYL